MSRMPGQPIDDDGKPIFPTATGEDDDVQGHAIVLNPPVKHETEDPEPTS
jgi:hypothetical protein